MDNGSVWSVPAGGVIGTLGKPLHLLCMSAHGKWLAYVEHNSNTVRIWTLATGEIRDLPQFSEQVQHFASSPDDSTLVVATKSEIPRALRPGHWQQPPQICTNIPQRRWRRPRLQPRWHPPRRRRPGLDRVHRRSLPAARRRFPRLFARWQNSLDAGRLNQRRVEHLHETKEQHLHDSRPPAGDRFTVRADGRYGVLSRSLDSVQLSVWDMHSGLQSGALHIPSQLGSYRVLLPRQLRLAARLQPAHTVTSGACLHRRAAGHARLAREELVCRSSLRWCLRRLA